MQTPRPRPVPLSSANIQSFVKNTLAVGGGVGPTESSSARATSGASLWDTSIINIAGKRTPPWTRIAPTPDQRNHPSRVRLWPIWKWVDCITTTRG